MFSSEPEGLFVLGVLDEDFEAEVLVLLKELLFEEVHPPGVIAQYMRRNTTIPISKLRAVLSEFDIADFLSMLSLG